MNIKINLTPDFIFEMGLIYYIYYLYNNINEC